MGVEPRVGASVKAGSPVDCRAASGPKPAVEGPARRKHAGVALRAVAPTISTIHSHKKWEITKDHAQVSFTCQAWSLFVLPRIALDGYIDSFSELKRGSFFDTL